MNNTCYYIDVNATEDEKDCLEIIDEVLLESNIAGFTILKNLQGGYMAKQNTLSFSKSYQVILMDISREKADASPQKRGFASAFLVHVFK